MSARADAAAAELAGRGRAAGARRDALGLALVPGVLGAGPLNGSTGAVGVAGRPSNGRSGCRKP